MQLTIKNSKSCKGRDGIAWSATLYIDGKKAADAVDAGNGGETNIYWYDDELEKQFGEYVKNLPLDHEDPEFFPNGRKPNVSSVIAGLVDELDRTKELKRWCKKKTLYRLKGDKLGEYRTLTHVFNPEMEAYLVKKHGDNLETIINKTL